MTETVDRRTEIRVESIERGIEYEIVICNPGEEAVKRPWRLNRKIEEATRDAATFSPLELGLNNNVIHDLAGEPSGIDLFLPDDPVAGLEWEGLGNRRMLRRKPWNNEVRRSPIRGPLRLGIVSAVPSKFGEYAELGDEISGLIGRKALDVTAIDAFDWEKFDAEIQADRFQCLHVLFKTELTPHGPQALIGGTHIPFDKLVQKVAQRGTRFAVLQDVTDDRHGMVALRLATQSLPSSCETSFLLCNGTPSSAYSGEMKGWYGSLLHDEPLFHCMTHLDREYQRGGVSLVCHAGSDRPLGLIDQIGMVRRYRAQVDADLGRIEGRPNIGSMDIAIVNIEAGQSSDAPLTELADAKSAVHEAEQELKQKIEKHEAEADQPRYPAAWFYHVDTVCQNPIPDTVTLTWPPPQGFGLEFHFWLDIIKTGISSIADDVPKFSAPDGTPYPLQLLVSVWSNDFEFERREQLVEVNARGRTERARFPIRKIRPAPREAELFVFMRHEGTLIAVFRVLAQVTEEMQRQEGAQLVEHAYVTNEWFQFEKAPSASALTIFITKRYGHLQLFTFKPTGDPWARIVPTEQNLYQDSKGIYDELQALAHRAEQALKSKAEFKFAKEAKNLAKFGYPLYGAVFLIGDSGASLFAEEYLGNLPEGSNLTIAIGKEAEHLFIPWGLLYDRLPPFGFFDAPALTGFLGYRYNLVVRPSTPHDGAEPKLGPPIRIGAAWLEHEETALLRAFYKPYETEKKLVVDPIHVDDHKLPALALERFDLIEFFCHGHTKVPSGLTALQAVALIKSYKDYDEKEEMPSLLMAINEVGNSDSLLDLSGGFVTLTSLAETLKKPMPGRPIILLSMCESAQVSAAGTGFVPLFLRRGARAVIGTEGPTLWSLSREMDTQIIARLLNGETISEAFYKTRKELAKTNVLALIYTLYGDATAKLVEVPLPTIEG